MKKRGKDISKLETVLDILMAEKDLPEKYKDHQLKGEIKEVSILVLTFQPL